MIKHITTLFILFLLGQSLLFSSNREYEKFDYLRKDDLGKYVVIVKTGDKYGVLDLFGNEIIKPEYDFINYSQESMFRVHKDSLYGYLDLEGKILLSVEYSNSSMLNYRLTHDYLKSDDFYIIHRKGKYGVFDHKSKKVIVPVEYDWVEGRDYAVNMVNTSKLKSAASPVSYTSALLYKDKKQSLVDLKTGLSIIDFGVYDSIEPSDQYGLIGVSKNGRNAFVDYQHNILVPFQDRSLGIGEFGFLSRSTDNQKVQFIANKSLSKSKEYDGITMYFNGLSLVREEDKLGVINAQGKEIISPLYDYIYITDDYIEATNQETSYDDHIKESFFDIEGNLLLPPLIYDGVEYNAKSGLAVVSDSENNEGLINEKGKLIMPLKYRRIYVDEDSNIIRFEVNTKSGVNMGLADIQGKILVKPKYNKIEDFIDGVAEIGVDVKGKYLHGLINLKGDEILKPQFSSIFFNMDSTKYYAQAYNDNKVGVIARDGRITVVPKYDEIRYQDRSTDDWGDLAITKLDNLYGVVNINTGQTIAESLYSYVYAIGKRESLLFCLRSDEGNLIINKDGKTIIPLTGDVMYPLSYDNNNKYLVRKQESDNKRGVITMDNKKVLPCIYDKITQLNRNLFKVELQGKAGIVDDRNAIVFPIEFDFISPYLYPDADLLFVKKGDQYGYIFLDKMKFEPSDFSETIYKSYIDHGIGL